MNHISRMARQALAWYRDNRAAFLAASVPLTPKEIESARWVGVEHPERVRIVTDNSPLRTLFLEGGAVGYFVFLRSCRDTVEGLLILIHELTHVKQFERAGGDENICKWLEGIAFLNAVAPTSNALEHEAVETTLRFARDRLGLTLSPQPNGGFCNNYLGIRTQ